VTERVRTRFAAEVAGTALLVSIGTGTIVAAARIGGIPTWATAVAWGAAVLVPILLFVRLSGAHLNPAVTLALAASGRVAWREVPPYVLAQVAGAFLGSAAVAFLLGRGAHLGATTFAGSNLGLLLLAEMSFTALLIAAVFALSDFGEGPRRWRLLLPPGAVALSTYVIGPITGSSLNPARTLAPAVLSGTFTDLWAYLVAVPVAALLVAVAWRPRSVDRLDRGPGRDDPSR
jgi:glycerol uptake facilitator-like aquaporin